MADESDFPGYPFDYREIRKKKLSYYQLNNNPVDVTNDYV